MKTWWPVTRAKDPRVWSPSGLTRRYQSGKRNGAWLKHKHRHRERTTMTAWRPGERRQPDEVLVSRRDDAGVLRHAALV
jgi:ATP-dependent DNA ligase